MLVQLVTQLPQIITEIVQLIKNEPSFEQVVLSGLQSIQKQMGALSEQVREGFSYVDGTLRGMGMKIETDTHLLESVAANGGQLQSDMAEITGKLDQIQATMYRIAESARDETLNTALNTYIGFPQRFGEELPLLEFAKAEGTFFTWGDESSLNAVSEHKGGSTNPNQVYAELAGTEGANPLNQNLDYLSSYANNAGWLDGLPPLTEVPNPEVWSAAANAYSQLLFENKTDVTNNVLSSIGELEFVGETVEPFIRAITEKGPSYRAMEVDGVEIDTGSSILNHALANYLNSAVAPSTVSGVEPSLANRIEAQENAILATQEPAVTDESYGHCSPCTLGVAPTTARGNTGEAFIDPWGGANQTPSGNLAAFAAASDPAQKNPENISEPAQMNLCLGAGEQSKAGLLPLFAAINADPLPAVYANAWHLGLGRLIACYAAERSGGGLKTQVNYLWENTEPEPQKKLVLRITIETPLAKVTEDSTCLPGGPVREMQAVWRNTSGEECAENEAFLEDSYTDVTSFVRKHIEEDLEEEKAGKLPAVSVIFDQECQEAIKEASAKKEEEVTHMPEPGHNIEPNSCEIEIGRQPLIGGARLTTRVEQELAGLRHDVYRHIAEGNASESLSEEAPADVEAAAVRVNGARALLDDYIEAGMPNAVSDDPELRDFVLGVGDNPAAAKAVGDHLLDNSPGAPNIYSVFTSEVGEIETGATPAILWPTGFETHCRSTPVPCTPELLRAEGANPNPVAESEKLSERFIPEHEVEHDGVVTLAFRMGVEQLARRIHADLETKPTGEGTEPEETEPRAEVAEEPMVESAAAQLKVTHELLLAAPVDTKPPEVTGGAVVGGTLRCSAGSWEARPAATFSYRWLRDGTSTSEGASHVVTYGDVGHELSCEVIASNDEGEASATSSPVRVAAAPGFTIEDAQQVKGSLTGFTKAELTVIAGQTIEYQVTVKNTGNVPLKLANFTDSDCGNVTGGTEEVAVEASTKFACERTIQTGTYVNEASIEGVPPVFDGLPLSHTSNAVVAIGHEAPKLTKQPVDTTVFSGEGATFTAEASGTPAPSVQWEVSTDGGKTFGPDTSDSGNNATTLTVPATSPAQNGNEYRARFSNVVEGVTSETVTLTVHERPAPAFTIEALQEIKGSESGFTKSELHGLAGQIVLYRLVVKNTGNVPLNLANMVDGSCANLAGGPGMSAVGPGESTVWTCERMLEATTTAINEAVVEGTPPVFDGLPLSHTSNQLIAYGPMPAPGVVTAGASEILQRSAVLNATVNSLGSEVKTCTFEYGTSTLGQKAPCSKLPGSGSAPVAVSATLTGLAPNTLYHYRISATNHGGTTQGGEASFKTPPAAAATAETGKASEVLQRAAAVAGTVNPNGGEVSTCTFEYGTSTLGQKAPCSKLPGSGLAPIGVSAQLTGLTPNSTYHYRISVSGPSGASKGAEATFKTIYPFAPTVQTGASSEVLQRTAAVAATVNPNGGEVTNCSFEYGTTTALKQSAPCSKLPGSGTASVAVSAQLKGLTPNSTYLYRISSTSPSGTSKGSEGTFKTTVALAPSAETKSASEVGEHGALLNATVNPNGAEVTSCSFEYGTTTLKQSVPCSISPGLGTSSAAVSAPLTGLLPNTTYHFRVSATTLSGTTKGTELSFKT